MFKTNRTVQQFKNQLFILSRFPLSYNKVSLPQMLTDKGEDLAGTRKHFVMLNLKLHSAFKMPTNSKRAKRGGGERVVLDQGRVSLELRF